ncbi:MAG: hypothetical protein P8X94_10540 [Woeseiaceae bacterium]
MEVPAAGTTLQINFSEPVEEARAQEFATWLRQVAHGVGDVNGSLPWPQITVRLVDDYRNDSAVAFGRVTRRDGMAIDLFVNLDRPIGEFYADWKATHEFSHLLLPRIDWRQRWISEGFASYYQNVLMARAGHYTREQAIAKLTSGFERGRASRPDANRRHWDGKDQFRQFDSQLTAPVFMPLYRRYADTPGFPDVSAALADDILLERIFAVRTSPN